MMLDPESTQKALELAKPFLEKIVNPPLEELGLLFQDHVRFWRLKRQLQMVNKASKLVEEFNIPTKEVPLKILAPLLENASLEEDDNLQDMWAKLLVNYADARLNYETSVFPYLLSQLSLKEAKALEAHSNTIIEWGYKRDIHFSSYSVNETELANLVRLGILRSISKLKVIDSHRRDVDYEIKEETFSSPEYKITALGIQFILACTKINK
jgi:hypothetical protein